METGAGVPGYSGGLAASPNVFFGMRITGFVLADEDVSAPGPIMETGAIVPGYSGGLAACVVVSDSELLVARPSRSGLFSLPERDALATY